MNSLEELAIKHGIKESHYIRGDEYIFTIEQLESLINEVISQRLGEPTRWQFLQHGQWHDCIDEQHRNNSMLANLSIRPLYALNIES